MGCLPEPRFWETESEYVGMCDIIPGFRKRFPRKEVRRAIATGQYHHYSGTATWANDGLSTRELHACELEEEHKVRPFDIDRERASVHVREERPVRLSCEETNRYGGAPPAPRQIVVFFPYGTKSQKLKAGYCERIKPGAFGRAIRSGREMCGSKSNCESFCRSMTPCCRVFGLANWTDAARRGSRRPLGRDSLTRVASVCAKYSRLT